MSKKRIIIFAANGFVGQHLVQFFSETYEVITATRHQEIIPGASKHFVWNGTSVGEWQQVLEGAEAVINLSGKSVNCRFTEANKKGILDSRVQSTRTVGEAIAQCENPPKLWFNASGISIYKETFEQSQTEEVTVFADDFLAKVTEAWERALFDSSSEVRKIALRTSVVFGSDGGSLPMILRLARWGAGGRQGSGKQYFSWIHIDDYCRALAFLIAHESLAGPVNLASPDSVPNAAFMKSVRKAVGVSFGLPAPTPMLKMGAFFLGTEPSLVLKGARIEPKVLIDAGFSFKYPKVDAALNVCVSAKNR